MSDWKTSKVGEYEFQVSAVPAIRNGLKVNGAYCYHIRILLPGADPTGGWLDRYSPPGDEWQTPEAARAAGLEAAPQRIIDEFGEPDLPSK